MNGQLLELDNRRGKRTVGAGATARHARDGARTSGAMRWVSCYRASESECLIAFDMQSELYDLVAATWFPNGVHCQGGTLTARLHDCVSRCRHQLTWKIPLNSSNGQQLMEGAAREMLNTVHGHPWDVFDARAVDMVNNFHWHGT